MKGFNEETAMRLGILTEVNELYEIYYNYLRDLFISEDENGKEVWNVCPINNMRVIDGAEGRAGLRKTLEKFIMAHQDLFIDFRGYPFVNSQRYKLLLKLMVWYDRKIQTFKGFFDSLGFVCVYTLYHKSSMTLDNELAHAENVLSNYLSSRADAHILSGENCELNVETDIPLYTYKSFVNLKCLREKHDIRYESLYYMSGSGQVIVVPTHFCRTCGKHFIAQRVLNFYDNSVGSLICKRINTARNCSGDFYSRLNEQSELHSYGYNVAEGNLTEEQRRFILTYLVNNDIMQKAEVVRDLLNAISLFENRYDRDAAVSKWYDDLRFIEEYQMNKPEINKKAYLKR